MQQLCTLSVPCPRPSLCVQCPRDHDPRASSPLGTWGALWSSGDEPWARGWELAMRTARHNACVTGKSSGTGTTLLHPVPCVGDPPTKDDSTDS